MILLLLTLKIGYVSYATSIRIIMMLFVITNVLQTYSVPMVVVRNKSYC